MGSTNSSNSKDNPRILNVPLTLTYDKFYYETLDKVKI